MGMYDELQIDKKHLPDNLQYNERGWQTKSYECLLDLLLITESGKLLVVRNNFTHREPTNEKKVEETNYTGEIRFYNTINNQWIEFVAFFENGKMFKINQVN